MKKNIIIIILLLITVGSLTVAGVAIYNNSKNDVLIPDVAPEKDENSYIIEGDNTERNPVSNSGGGSVSITYMRDLEINLDENKIDMLFANPNKSNQDMLVQVLIQETVIAQSELIKAGYQIEELPLIDGVSKKLELGTYDGLMMVYYYNQETGEKAMVSTEIPLTIKVTRG